MIDWRSVAFWSSSEFPPSFLPCFFSLSFSKFTSFYFFTTLPLPLSLSPSLNYKLSRNSIPCPPGLFILSLLKPWAVLLATARNETTERTDLVHPFPSSITLTTSTKLSTSSTTFARLDDNSSIPNPISYVETNHTALLRSLPSIFAGNDISVLA